MANILKSTIMGALLLAVVAFGTSQAQADPVTFSTSGVFTCVAAAVAAPIPLRSSAAWATRS
jgi:hypothetical protein